MSLSLESPYCSSKHPGLTHETCSAPGSPEMGCGMTLYHEF